MSQKPTPRPTDAELGILQMLWRLGPSTVRQIHNAFNKERETETGYTTTLKLLQIMMEKGLVERDETERPQIYRARLSQEETQRQMVSDLVDRVFGGSARQLVMQALAAKEASDEELAQVEQLLDKLEGDSQ